MKWWRVVGGPREFAETGSGDDIDIGWAYDIERDGQLRTVSVWVAGGRLDATDLPEDARRAIQTRGESAVRTYCDADDPPAILIVSSAGVRPRT